MTLSLNDLFRILRLVKLYQRESNSSRNYVKKSYDSEPIKQLKLPNYDQTENFCLKLNLVIKNNDEIKLTKFGIETTYYDPLIGEGIEKLIKKNTKVIFIESPGSLSFEIPDVAAICKVAKKHDIVTIFDNSWASGIYFKPLDHGVDVSVTAITKYINGHSDIIGGALIIGKNKKLADKIAFIQNSVGAIPSPFDCFLILRAIKTLSLRMKQHNHNGLKVAKYLEKHKKIIKVVYPGLTTHSQHKIAKKQMDGYGEVVTFFHKGNLKEIKRFMQKLKIFTIAESLGGVESLIESPALMTHAYVNTKVGQLTPIPENLIRISVGIEHADDLIEDLKQAL